MRFGNTEVEILPTPAAVAERAAERTREAADLAIAARGRFVLALSGGSTPRLYHEALVSQIRDTLDWTKVFILFSDERAVSPDHKDSNYRMAEETLLSALSIPSGNVFRIEADDGDHVRAALAYETLLVQHGLLPADLIILGMGEDGHTASLFPISEARPKNGALKATNGRWVIHQEAPSTSPVGHRVTFSYAAIAAGRGVLGLITGHSKAARLAEVLMGPGDLPMQRVLRQRQDNTILLIDQAAASHLVDATRL